MEGKRPRLFRKRLFRFSLLIAGLLLFSTLGLHIWFVNNARGVLKQIVYNKSGGKIKLELSRLTYDFFSNRLQIRNASLVSTDSVSSPVTYHVQFRKLTFRIGSFWPLLLQNRLLLDSIKLHDPDITLTQWRRDTIPKTSVDELSVPQAMGKIYNSMLDVLEGFGIRRIIINNARVNIINKTEPGIAPVIISKIYFDLIRTATNVKKRDEYVENEQSIDLSTTNQRIVLPSGRHNLSFKSFSLHLFQRKIILDSCTITATETSRSKSNYTIFFKKLLLKGVDFSAMYHRNLIRADSVYCENPLFQFNLNQRDIVSNQNEAPDPEKIVRELTGDLELAFVGVKNAGIHLNISGSKTRSLFNSNKDNFELRGLRINADSAQPVVVKRFDMLVRDYRLYNEDSSATYSFDSIRFENNKVVLNNFTVKTESSRTKIRDERDFTIPYFHLTGLDWYQLIFEQNLKAREAFLFNPVIYYVKQTPSGTRSKKNLFAYLNFLDNLVTLDKINVTNGQIDVRLGTASINLQNANLSLYSGELLQSTNREGLRRAIDFFSFSQGLLRFKDITAQLQNAEYTGSNLIHTNKISISNPSKSINAAFNDVYIDNLLLDDKTETVVLDGLRWKAASVALQTLPVTDGRGKGSTFNLKNISGSNTQITISTKKADVSTIAETIKLASLSKSGDAPLHIEGLLLSGNKLTYNNGPLQVHAGGYHLVNNQSSTVTDVQIRRIQPQDSILVSAPRIDFSADANQFVSGDPVIKMLRIQNPVIKVSKWNTASAQNPGTKATPSIRIDHLTADEPVILIVSYRNDSVTVIDIPHSENSKVSASGLTLNNGRLQAASFSLHTTSATLAKGTGEKLGVEKGKVNIDLSNLYFSNKEGKPVWRALINSAFLQNPNSITIGKKNNTLTLEQAAVGNVALSSEYITDVNRFLKFNVSAWLRTTTGQYTDSTTTLKWYNANYNYSNKTLRLDSFVYYPTQPLDSVIAQTPYQTDYITFRSGALKLTEFNLEEYNKDSALLLNTMQVSNPVLTVYRDKLPPFRSGIIKPLPVDMIRRISYPVSVQRVNITDGMLSYTERNAKTRAEGTLHLTHITGRLRNIKNRDIKDDDSLSLHLDGYLMDSALVNLHVKESYTDSLNGFLMTVRMKPTTLTFINPVLMPMSNVKIVSGTIDSFHLRAIGREHVAIGAMNMYYHNLRIKLIKDGDAEKTTFMTNVLSSLINTFLIRKNNNGRNGVVYFERLRDRSFFNYVVKITFSGMVTSIGVVKSRKYLKRYKRLLEEKDLPPIEFE
ncbi:MAG: hypothetical protein ICV65_05585 [Flavisolibacter sp.]|nr:hypothetical protein [Flavisolibacter sp.]